MSDGAPKTQMFSFARKYLFDQDSRSITVVPPTGSSQLWTSIANQLSLHDRKRWLYAWALWIDRAEEPAVAAAARIDARACLGKLLDCPRPEDVQLGSWIDVSHLPQFPHLAARLEPPLARFPIAAAITTRYLLAYRIALRHWARAERARWSERRHEMTAEVAIERRYKAACERLKLMLQAPDRAPEVHDAIQAILAQILPWFRVSHLTMSRTGSLSLVVDFADAGHSLALTRHTPDTGGWRLVALDGKTVADQRFRELAVLAALAVAELLQELCNAKNAMTLIVRPQIQPAPFRQVQIQFFPEQLMASRSSILGAIATRHIPKLPGLRFINSGTQHNG